MKLGPASLVTRFMRPGRSCCCSPSGTHGPASSALTHETVARFSGDQRITSSRDSAATRDSISCIEALRCSFRSASVWFPFAAGPTVVPADCQGRGDTAGPVGLGARCRGRLSALHGDDRAPEESGRVSLQAVEAGGGSRIRSARHRRLPDGWGSDEVARHIEKPQRAGLPSCRRLRAR